MEACTILGVRRSRLPRLVLVVAVLGIVASLGTAVGARASQPGLVLIGDSVTAGYGASDAAHAWPALLGVPVQGEAGPGMPSGFFVGQTWVAHTVVVELGINDCQLGVGAATYGDHMRQILAGITASRVIVVVPYETGREARGAWAAYADQLAAIAAADPRVVLTDLRPAFGRPSTDLLAPDLIHPNDRGHAVIARLVTAALGA